MLNTPAHSRPIVMAVIAVTMVASAAVIGNLATLPNIPTWYASLTKPAFNPPNWIFGPVWGLLYVMIAVALWRILILPSNTKGKGRAVIWFAAQMALNALWSVAFFGLHAPLAGLIVIGLLWLMIIATLFAFYALDKLASALLIPYLLWVSFASVLNAFVWWLNT